MTIKQRIPFGWLAAALSLAYLLSYLGHPELPGNDPAAIKGWFGWWDQGKYLASADAFAHGSLDASSHWYLPGYPLIAAPFVWLVPNHPFAIPDLLLLLACGWLLVETGTELGIARPLAMLAVLFGICGSPFLLAQWAVPWSSTLSAAALSWIAYLYVRSVNHGLSARRCLALGVAPVLIAATRPSDVLAILPIYAHLTWITARSSAWGKAGAALASFAAAAAAFGALYLAIYGPNPSPYMISSAQFGLRPELLPFRFYVLFIDPQPFYGSVGPVADQIRGIVQRWPPVALGLVGALYGLILLRRHWAFPATIFALIAAYLTYPDWQPTSIWLYGLIHYVKWTFPAMGLATLAMVSDIKRRPTIPRIGLPLLLAALGLASRYKPVVLPNALVREGPRTFVGVNATASPLIELKLEGASGNPLALSINRNNHLEIDGRELADLYDYRVLSSDGALYVILDRPQMARQVRFVLGPEASFASDAGGVLISGRLTFRSPRHLFPKLWRRRPGSSSSSSL